MIHAASVAYDLAEKSSANEGGPARENLSTRHGLYCVREGDQKPRAMPAKVDPARPSFLSLSTEIAWSPKS